MESSIALRACEIWETRKNLSSVNLQIADLEAGRAMGSIDLHVAYRNAIENRLRKLEQDFALATGTAVRGMYFNTLAEREMHPLQEIRVNR